MNRGTVTFIVMFLHLSLIAIAQENGEIRGRIADVKTGEALAGAHLTITETFFAAVTDHHGQYRIRDIAPGKYEIKASYLGYTTKVRSVEITRGEILTIDFQLTEGTISMEDILLIEAERPLSAASSKAIRRLDMKLRPARSSQDMLRLVPGLIIAQHAGGGKAEQIFMRGFDNDHGTDIALSVDGLPVNMVTHGHGQGYADLHFLIPEIIESIDVYKGPYFTRFGNLATSGAAEFKTRDHVERNSLRVEGGSFQTTKITGIFNIPVGGEHENAYFAGQYYGSDGPFDQPQDFKRFNLFGKFHTHLSEHSRLIFSASSFTSAWDASGQIPQRAVDQGLITRFGSIDPFEGGTTGRQDISLRFESGVQGQDEFLLQAYGTWYNFKLFSDFTYYLDDPVVGDMIEQTDQRRIAGLKTRLSLHGNIGSTLTTTSFGGGYRADDISLALWKSPDRIRSEVRSNADVCERNFNMWFEEHFIFSRFLRLQLGLRGDYFAFNVNDKVAPGQATDLPHESGYAHDFILNPKLNLVLTPTPGTNIFLNTGSGFHSNDARDVIIAARTEEISEALRLRGAQDEEIDAYLDARNLHSSMIGIKTLPRALGGELGVRSQVTSYLVLSAAAWGLRMEEELVFVGDAGTTETSGRTQRLGIDIEIRWQILPWLWIDSDLNLSQGRYLDEAEGENCIPLAPTATSTGGITAVHPSGLASSLRYRYVDDRPANEDGSVTALGHTLLDFFLGYDFGSWRVFAKLENILDVEWNEAQFDTESRLRGETEPVSELHFTPGNPFNAQLGLAFYF